MFPAPPPCRIKLPSRLLAAAAIGLAACPIEAQSLTLTQALGEARSATQPCAVMAPAEAPASGAKPTWLALLAELDQAPSVRENQARADAREAIGRQSDIKAWLPRLDASVRADDQRQTYNGLASRTPSSASSLQATLPLWRPAERAMARADDASAEQARWQLQLRRQTLAREVTQAYLGALEAAEHARLTRAHALDLAQQAEAHQKRLDAGLGTLLDTLETRARHEQAQADVERLNARTRSLTLTLQRLSGQDLPAPGDLPGPLAGTGGLNLPAWPQASAQALAAHPEILDAQAGVRSALASLQAKDAERWQPSLDAVASHNRTRQTQRFEGQSERQDVRTEAIGLVLNWPLFTSGLQDARQREAAAWLAAAQARLEEAQARVSTELQDAYQRHERAQRQQALQAAVVTSAQASLEASLKAWQAGLRSTADLLDARQRLHDARMAWVSARVATLQAGSDALAVLGILDAEHLAPWLAATGPAPHAPPSTCP